MLEDVLSKYQERLRPNYTEKDNASKADCVRIAYDLARQLLQEDEKPIIQEVNPGYDEPGYPQPGLRPQPYRDVSFYKHFVATTKQNAYDPILGKTVPVSDYTRRLFNDDSPSMTVKASTKRIREELRRRPHEYLNDRL